MSINRNLAKFAPSINTSGKAAVATITVTVSGGKYYIDGTQQQTISLAKGITYRLDNSDSTNSGHPLVFSTESNGGGSSFSTGITTVGTAGSTGAYIEVTLEQDAPDHLGYYCSNHSGMGGLVKTAPIGDANFASFASAFTFPTSDGSASQVLQTDGSGTISFGTPAASYGNSDVDTHLNYSSATSGQVLSYNGSDYAWVSSSGYTDSDVDTHLNRSSASGGDYLFYNGSDYSWATALTELSDDTSPSLGGNLDVVTRSIVSTSNRDINITPDGTGKVVLDGLSYPSSDGSANFVLTTNGSGTLSFQTVGGNLALGEISDDTTPSLGGDLDVVTRSIVSTSNRNINITPNGTGKVVLDGLSYPDADGSANQVLKTDGSGNLSFVDQSSGGIASVAADTTPQLGGDLDVNGQSIVSASNGNIAITPNGSGKIILDGLSFPTADGSASQVLQTDGSGQLSFADQSGGLSAVNSHTKTLSSDVTVAATDNAFSVGPLTVASGVTITISSGARYAVI